jgi:tartrate/fumarate subfamily iron-sulfur-dependent hydro-lyase beta chain
MANTKIQLNTPLAEDDIRKLRCGDFVELNGLVFTARDAAHKKLFAGARPACDLRNSIIYHCGPVTVCENGQWRITAAGPTTSIREEPYMPRLIRDLGIRAVIGKGGLGVNTLAACREYACVYLHAVGGAAQLLASSIKKAENVFWLEELGPPEAIWQLQVRKFPAVVTMDTNGESLHECINKNSFAKLKNLLGN